MDHEQQMSPFFPYLGIEEKNLFYKCQALCAFGDITHDHFDDVCLLLADLARIRATEKGEEIKISRG